MRYLIDTSSLSRAIRDDSSRLSRIVWHLGIDQVAVSVMTLLEIEYGLQRRRIARAAQIRDFVSQFQPIDFDRADASAAGALRARLEATGHPIGIIDTMLAAQALIRGLTVVTHNAKEFGRISDLRVVEL
jgi:tRNA(fMet)-specific endonuclease VapC